MQATSDHADVGNQALGVKVAHVLNVFTPKHGEVRLDHFVAGRQVEPDLKELGGVGLIGMAQGKHFAMHDALASGEPLNVAWTKAGGGTQ